jgi:hypothetical protein
MTHHLITLQPGTAAPPPSPDRRATARRVAGRALALLGAALVLAVIVVPWRPPTLCFLRAVTGIPCPLCGGTTAMVELGRGRPLAALAASPLATLAAPLWVAWPAVRHRAAEWAARAGRRQVLLGGALVLVAGWLWQLERVLGPI